MKKITLLLLSLLLAAGSYAQSVGINSDGTAPDGSAMLDVKSTNKGFLPPRIALTGTTDVSTISSPATGLLIYNTANTNDVTSGYYYYSGLAWIKVDAGLWSFDLEEDIYTNYNVGIGTTTPSQKLDVVGYGRFYNDEISKMTIQTSSATHQASVDLLNSTLCARWILDANDLFRVFNQTSNFDAFVVKANGYVGIGTTTPLAKLHIAGFGSGIVTGITMTPENNTEGGHYISFLNTGGTAIGSIARGSGENVVYNTTSDYRLKENVVNIDINQAKSRLMALRPVEYNYISDTNKTVISGFLAHEMADAGFANGVTGEKDAVDKDGKPIYQAIDTKYLIPEMVKVIQEQQAEIEALKKELEEIKKVLQYKK